MFRNGNIQPAMVRCDRMGTLGRTAVANEQQWIVRSSADVGRAVADIRRRSNLTQEELAASVGIGRSWLSKLESGASSRVLEHLLRLLRRLGATITITFNDRAPDGES